MSTHTFQISIPKDDDGFVGRECLECKRYFKLKPGTGLPTQHCHCPYCEYEGDQNTFWTQDQLDYAQSVGKQIAYEKLVEPLLDDLTKSFKKLESSTRGGFLQIKVNTTRTKPFFPIKYYNESELETLLTCDNCKLEFAIYGVFSRCPDCSQLNAFSIFQKSIEVCKKQIDLFNQFPHDKDVELANLKFILSNAISSFDGLGKELRKKLVGQFPDKPKNLFQNIDELEKVLLQNFSLDIKTQLSDYSFLRQMFQVRHVFEHNMGVVDADFIRKVPSINHLVDRKYPLTLNEVQMFLGLLTDLGKLIEDEAKKHYT
ncbi:MAG: hypothetical protein IPN43_17235 [Chitinophagaceae bacterium]|nr:hypothetical protein [Chitinophagaceae bacterium]